MGYRLCTNTITKYVIFSVRQKKYNPGIAPSLKTFLSFSPNKYQERNL